MAFKPQSFSISYPTPAPCNGSFISGIYGQKTGAASPAISPRATVSPPKGQVSINSLQFHVAEAVFLADTTRNRACFSHPVPIHKEEAISQVWRVKNIGVPSIPVPAYSCIPCWKGQAQNTRLYHFLQVPTHKMGEAGHCFCPKLGCSVTAILLRG